MLYYNISLSELDTVSRDKGLFIIPPQCVCLGPSRGSVTKRHWNLSIFDFISFMFISGSRNILKNLILTY